MIKLQYPTINIDWNTIVSDNATIKACNMSSISLKNVVISDNVKILATRGGRIEIRNSYIGFNTVITSINSIEIDSHCEIAEMVVIRDQNHSFGEKGRLLKDQGYDHAPISIESNVWIGAKATILKGVIIGENSIVGAHSLINKSIPKNCVCVGIPGKLVKSF